MQESNTIVNANKFTPAPVAAPTPPAFVYAGERGRDLEDLLDGYDHGTAFYTSPQPGDKIICNNGEEFICCTLDFLWAKGTRPARPQAILGFNFAEETWQDWDEDGHASLAPEDDYNIREVIPQSSEVTADKKEEVKEDSLYTVDEVFDAIFETTKHLQIEIPWDYIDDVKAHLSRKNDKQYQEYLRLKAIYE